MKTALRVIATLLLGTVAAGLQAQTKLKVVFPTTVGTHGLPHYVAQDLGWFKKAGLDVEEVTVLGDANAIRAMVAGQSDVAHMGTVSVYGAVANGVPIKAFGSVQPIPDYQLIAQRQYRTLKDLESTRIAAASIGGLTTAIPTVLMKKHGLDPGKMIFASVGGHEARLQAVLGNKLDATLVSNLFAEVGQKMGGVNVIVSVAKELPGLGFMYYAATDSALADAGRRKAFELYAQGIVEGARFVMKNPAEAAKVLKGRMPELEGALLERVVHSLNSDNVWPINGGLDREVTDFTVKFALEYGLVKGALRTEQVIDPRIVNAVMPRLGRQ